MWPVPSCGISRKAIEVDIVIKLQLGACSPAEPFTRWGTLMPGSPYFSPYVAPFAQVRRGPPAVAGEQATV